MVRKKIFQHLYDIYNKPLAIFIKQESLLYYILASDIPFFQKIQFIAKLIKICLMIFLKLNHLYPLQKKNHHLMNVIFSSINE